MLDSIESQGIGFEFNALLITLEELFISGGSTMYEGCYIKQMSSSLL